jgi:TRAP-type C4-dicarboxylate transport system permease small subunit
MMPDSRFARLLRHVGRVELLVALVAFCFVIGLVSTQVVLRFSFNYGIWWVQEVVQLAILTAYFLGTSYLFKARQYLVMDLVFDQLGERSRIAVYLAIQVLTAAFCLILAIELVGLAPGQLRMKTFVLHVPRFYASIPLLVASASMFVTALYYGLAMVSRVLRGERDVKRIEAAVCLFPVTTGASTS